MKQSPEELIRRLAMVLDGSLDLLDRAAEAERRREAGKRMRQITMQQRAEVARELLAEADAYLAGRVREAEQVSWFTVWVSDASQHGTHFVQAFQAADIEDAKQQALLECAACWGDAVEELTILGVAEGDVRLLEWNEDHA
jgi:hypothetical protein